MWITRIAVFFIVLAAGVTFASSQPMMKDRMMKERGEYRREMMEDLQLTDEQQVQMQKLHLQLEKKQAGIESEMKLKRLDLKEELIGANPDQSKIEKSIKAINDLQLQMKLTMVDHVFKAKAMLTPEQQKKFKQHLLRLGGDGPERPQRRMMREHHQ
jgi:Spy/CpxP family protein refolding chaperone